MDFWILIGATVLLLLCYPYLRCFVKRIILSVKIKKLCQKRGFHLYPAHPFPAFGTKGRATCDFYIETKREILAVKLFACKRAHADLCFTQTGEYYFCNYVAFISIIGTSCRIPLETKKKQLPAYDFRYRYRDAWEIKLPKNILLVHPVCREIKYAGKTMGAGDVIANAELYSLSRLIGYLEVCD